MLEQGNSAGAACGGGAFRQGIRFSVETRGTYIPLILPPFEHILYHVARRSFVQNKFAPALCRQAIFLAEELGPKVIRDESVDVLNRNLGSLHYVLAVQEVTET
jgi:hypothetical protein